MANDGGKVTIKIKGDAGEFKDTLDEIKSQLKKIGNEGSDGVCGLNESFEESIKLQRSLIKETEGTGKAIKSIKKNIDDAGDAVEKAGQKTEKTNQKNKKAIKIAKTGLADIKAGIDMAATAARKLSGVAWSGIEYNADLEKMQTSFEVMTGSAKKAREIADELRTMGAETPFKTDDLARTVQMLMQYGFAADDAMESLKMLGDISQGSESALDSISLGYAQMVSSGKVNLQDLRQMINGGFNPIFEISQRTGESMASLYDRISKGTMSIDEIAESMRYATSEGGQFFASMAKQSQTLSGQLTTLKDNANRLLGDLTSGLSDELRDEILPLANKMIGDLETAYAEGGVQGLINRATEMTPALLDMMSGEVQTAIQGLAKWLPKGAKALMQSVPGAIKANSEAIPQITAALFEVSGVVAEELMAMLPELVPVMLKGLGSMAESLLGGVFDVVDGVFDGIDRAIHSGKTKVAQLWVDDDEIAKFKIEFDANIDTRTADAKITTAYKGIKEKLEETPLTESERNTIIGMISEGYQTICDQLVDFRLSPEDAQALAASVDSASRAAVEELEKINVGVDGQTLLKWMVQANDSRIALREILKSEGLNDADIAEIVSVFDTMHGRIEASTPNIAEEIYTELTDGLTDNPDELKARIEAYIAAQDKAIDEAYNKSVAKLDPADGDYAEKLAQLNETYAQAKADLGTIGSDLDILVDTLANASTATVQSKYQLLAEVETQVNSLSAKIDDLAGKADAVGLQAYNVVRSGANADEATISRAISYKVSQFRLDTQSAKDAYAEMISQLNEDLSSGKIGKEEYNQKAAEAKETLDTQTAAARQIYENALGQIFSGIAESEGLYDKMGDNLGKLNLADVISKLIDSGMDMDALEGGAQGLVEQVRTVLGDAAAEELAGMMERGDDWGISHFLTTWALSLINDAEGAFEDADTTKLAAAYQKTLEVGALEGTYFDTGNSQDQMMQLLVSIYKGASAKAEPEVKTEGESISENFADALISSAEQKAGEVRSVGETLGKALADGAKSGLEIHSPSRVGREIGQNFGGSISAGLKETIGEAVKVANHVSGRMVTAATLATRQSISFAGLESVIVAANQQTTTPINLDGRQIAEIQGLNNSAQIAWQNTRGAKGVGSR